MISTITNSQKKSIISVCIATYKREALLEKLLKSLFIQKNNDSFILEIILVDNDFKGSANKVLEKLSVSEKQNLKYFVQPVKNISLTRNMSIQNATGEFICFIDDDETASVNWVTTLYNALKKYNADGVFGYVEPVFDEKIPDFLKKREFYFTKLGPTGTTSLFHFTTNAIIRADLINNEESPFSPDYGLTGGEDSHLFERLVSKGAKFIDCMEAVTYEFIPKERGTIKYLFNRSLRGGQAFARKK